MKKLFILPIALISLSSYAMENNPHLATRDAAVSTWLICAIAGCCTITTPPATLTTAMCGTLQIAPSALACAASNTALCVAYEIEFTQQRIERCSMHR